MLCSGFLEFKLDYAEKKGLAIGAGINSDEFSAGGHLWRVRFWPRGIRDEHNGEYVSIHLWLVSRSGNNVKAFFDVSLLNRDGTPSFSKSRRLFQIYQPGMSRGFTRFTKGSILESSYLTNGVATFICGVIVVPGSPTPVPPPDIAVHLGELLDCAVGSDVSFVVGDETFPAHRAVLAARSPVFRAELFGSMADAAMPSITLREIEPAVFKVMLRFIYTDCLPEVRELGDSPTDMLQHLIAAADRYALERLKLVCSLKLIEYVSVDTVGSVLVCAEAYNCPELKVKCLDFFAVGENFKEAAFTDGFVILVQKFPSLAAELRSRVVKS
ncbi:hypothetical protein U9M48_038191 [Paspalum notatum var. saurae]|uniref:Uncharacterized protein n=1 Tax=Paspalum notatum var. saurae TaxID=547442 RepID=A0AAQ3UHI4_PASNO